MRGTYRRRVSRQRSVSSATTIAVVATSAIIGFAAFVTPSGPAATGDPIVIEFPLEARVAAAVFAGSVGNDVATQVGAAPETQRVETQTATPEAASRPIPIPTAESSATTTTTHPPETTTTTQPPATTTTTSAPTTTTRPPTTTTTTTHAPHPPSTTTTAPPVTTTVAPPPTTTTAPPPTTTTTPPPTTTLPPGEPGERWRPLVSQYFPTERVEEALSVIWCESRGNPAAVNASSGATGLFQFIPSTWGWASPAAGWAGYSATNAEANIASAAWLVQSSLDAGQSAWKHWSCKP